MALLGGPAASLLLGKFLVSPASVSHPQTGTASSWECCADSVRLEVEGLVSTEGGRSREDLVTLTAPRRVRHYTHALRSW